MMVGVIRRLNAAGARQFKCRPAVYMAARKKSRRHIRENIIPCAESDHSSSNDQSEQGPSDQDNVAGDQDDSDVMSMDTVVERTPLTKSEVNIIEIDFRLLMSAQIPMLPVEIRIPSVQESFFHFLAQHVRKNVFISEMC